MKKGLWRALTLVAGAAQLLGGVAVARAGRDAQCR